MRFACELWPTVGFAGPIRCDHAPAMYGGPNVNPGYEARGRPFAIGYMKGLPEGVDAMRAGETMRGSTNL